MTKTRKLLALILALLMLVSMAACKSATVEDPSATSQPNADNSAAPPAGNGGNTETDDGGGTQRTLNVVAMQDSGTLYPLGVTGSYFSVMYSIYEPLLDTKADGTRLWILATGMDPISDLQNTLHLREGVTFSNGNPFTAEDVIFTMETNRDNPQFSLNVKAIDFEKTSIINDYTIDLWYTEYNAAQEVGMCQMLMLDKESFDEVSLARDPVGTGPYTKVEYVTNSHLLLEAREDYWGGSPKIKSLQYKVINEQSQIVNSLETGDVDVASVPITEVDFVKSLGYNVEIYNSGMNHATWFSMIPGTPLESKEARWAVSHAINREGISDLLFAGLSSITDYPGSHALTDFEPRFANMHDTYSIGYDLDKAREYAEQSGLVGKTLRLITNGSSDMNTLAEIIQGNLLDIDVNVDIISYDQATFFGTMMDANNFEIALFTPSAPSMMAVDIFGMYLTFIPLGWDGPEREEYGRLSMGALTTFDEASRSEQLYEAMKIFVDFDPWYGLVELIAARTCASDLRGIEYMVSGNVYYQNVYFAS